MWKNRKVLLCACLAALYAFSFNSLHAGESSMNKGIYAILKTNQGDILCELYDKESPNTVENFVGLASGTKEYHDPKTGKQTKGNFYDGLIFHRVISNFMIQGGCPLGTGTGGPGYKFDDEYSPNLKFDKPGLLAMANSGQDTNGSQFFITVAPTPWLNSKHTIFGAVIEGMDVVKKIENVKKGPQDRPIDDVIIESIEIKNME